MSKSKLNTAARVFALVIASIFGGAFALFIVGCIAVFMVSMVKWAVWGG